MANWRLAPSLKILLTEVNSLAPERSRASDGSISSEAHRRQNPGSDHDPNERGVVTALDITHDPLAGCNGGEIADRIRIRRDPRVKYVIFNRRMFSSYPAHGVMPWTWRAYSGENPHTKHVHVSVIDAAADDHPWLS